MRQRLRTTMGQRQLTRRDLIARTTASALIWPLASGQPSSAIAATPSRTVVLVNESYLRRKYPNEVAALLTELRQFAARNGAELLFVGANASPRDIKVQLLKHTPRPQRLVIFGDDEAIPRLAVNWKNNFVYFFKGDKYVRYNLADETFGSLKLITGNWPGLPADWPSASKTAVSWRDNTIYFFKNSQYLKYNFSQDTAGVVRPIAGHWPGFPPSWAATGIDAAVNWGNGKAYFFKSDQYLRYDIAADRVDDGYPRTLSPQTWSNWPAKWASGIDAAVALNNGKAYFFKGREFLRYDISGDRVDGGYPLPIAGHWRGLPNLFLNGIDFVMRAPGRDVPVDYFYGDLDRDGLSEVPTSRILGSPRAMIRQLGATTEPTAPHALLLNAEPRDALEANQLCVTLTERGCTLDAIEQANVSALPQADLIIHNGHGNPDGFYGTFAGAYVTASTVPDLPRRPVVFAGACSTATPGAAILRAFMEKGCRSYVGAVSDSYGQTSGYLGNELYLHFIDALREHPNGTVAELISAARTRFVQVNHLAPLLLKLENGEYPDEVDGVMVDTALQMQVFGDISARFPRAARPPVVSRRQFAQSPIALKAGESIPLRYDIQPSDGLATLAFRAEWDKDVSDKLEVEIIQNGELLHRLDWKEQREWWAYADTHVGGYWDRRLYKAIALAPLKRRLGSNEASIRLVGASKAIRVTGDSEIQIWPKRNPKQPSQLARKPGLNLLWICYNDDAEPMRNALGAIDGAQVDHFDTFGDMLAPYEFTGEPGHLLDLGRYDVIFIDYLWRGYRDIARGVAPQIRDFVRQGGGLIMAGGPQGFSGKESYRGFGGQGGFGGTAIEEALPVRLLRNDDAVDGSTKVGDVNTQHPITAGLDWSSLPGLRGYNRVAAKPQAAVLARTTSHDPFLVAGSFGKGRAVAVTTSSSRTWGAEFKTWAHYNRFWAQVIRWAKR